MHLIAFRPLKCMTSLTHLDLSSEKYSHPFESFSCDTPWLQFLTDPDWLPNLVSLDISGLFYFYYILIFNYFNYCVPILFY